LHPHRLQQVIDYVNEYLDQDIKLTDLAECAGMSQYYFVHLFKQAMGITPHQYLIQQRVERAKQLLKLKNVVISDIAFQCGFNSQSHLTRIFRQVTGMTPKSYRDNL
jgi:AraC family transcriptional regulator